MRRFIGSLFIISLILFVTPWGQRFFIHQIPAWVIRDGGFKVPPDQVVQVGNLQGYYFPPSVGQPTLFFAHGSSSRNDHQFQRLSPALDKGYGLYYVTYPGYDQNLFVSDDSNSFGWRPQFYSEAGGKQALVDHWQAYLELGGDPETTILAAESLGSALMPWFVEQLPEGQTPYLMVILAGFDEFSNVIRSKTFGLINKSLIHDPYDNTGIWEALNIPTYFGHGDMDWLVSAERARAAARRMTASSYFQIYQGVGHLNLPLGEVILEAAKHDFGSED